MSQFGDGGLLASKPYCASGAYIDRMSDYCGRCRYDVKQRIGPDACPFNALYWDFLDRNSAKLRDNQRLAMPYRNLERMADEDREAIRCQAQSFLETLG
jgi:deoxyribodipyrimidine photolyase-related protein